MHPFNVTIPQVEDPDLGPLLSRLADAGYPEPIVQPIQGEQSQTLTNLRTDASGELPTSWTEIRRLEDQTYRWPEYLETYESYVIYTANTEREGNVNIALGKAPRARAWGRDREYVIAFLSGGGPQNPLAEFLETDPEGSGELIAVIRGQGGEQGRRMYGPADSLPDVYSNSFKTVIYRDHIDASGAWNKVGVLAKADDHTTMLNHALVQARRRRDI